MRDTPDIAADAGELARMRSTLLDTFRPLIDPARPLALIDFPDSSNSGDHLIWLGEKRLLAELGLKLSYECSVATYDKRAMAAAVGSGTILMHGGGNFGDLYTLYPNFRLQVLRDFPDNPILVLPQTVMFFSNAALRSTAEHFARHRNVTLAARDVLSYHVLTRSFGGAARVVLAPDMAMMLGPLRRSCTPNFDVVWINRTDHESAHGPDLAAAAKLPPLKQVSVDMGAFDDGLGGLTTADVAGTRLLVSDWYRMRLPGQEMLARYKARNFDQQSRVLVDRAVRLLSAGRVVVTDRLHGHILCTLAGIPHVLLNNSYGKNISYFETWSRPNSLCHLVATPADAWTLARKLAGPVPAPANASPTDGARLAAAEHLH